MKNKLFLTYCVFVVALFLLNNNAFSQLNNFSSGYFQNQYLFNPAMSGVDAKKGKVGLGYRKMGDFKDAPYAMFLTGDYGFNEKVGAGINVFYDRAGLINSTKIMGTYSYHLKLDAEGVQKLHLGISVGGVHKRLNNNDVHGDIDDPALYNYNDQFMRFEADFGAAYIYDKLTIQAAAPNLVSSFQKNKNEIVEGQIFYGAVSYKFAASDNEDQLTIEPKVAFRAIRQSGNILDAGANFSFKKELVNIFVLYHSNKSISAGAGLRISNIVHVNFIYNTQGDDFKSYSKGNYEIGLKFF